MAVLSSERLIGRGSNGSVYLAEDAEGRKVAVKVLEGPSSVALSLWENEVSLLAKLRHPHLIEILGFSRDGREFSGHEGSPCYWMEYVEGASLLEAARGTDPARIAGWLHEALEALEYLHAQDVLHGDLKPSNILIDATGRLKLVDFGFASLLSAPARNADVRGTLPYLPPEALNGRLEPASDLFSLGVSFYEAFAGTHPRANARDVAELYAHCPKPLARLGLPLPPRVAKVVDRSIEADRALRWKSAREALAGLDQDRPKFSPKSKEPTKTSEGPLQSFRLFGRDRARESVEAFRKSRIEKEETGLVWVHGLTGVGRTRFVQELYYDWTLQGLGAVLSRPPVEGPLVSEKDEAAVRFVTEAEGLQPSHLKDLHRYLVGSRGKSGVLVLESNDELLPDFLREVIEGLARNERVLDLPLTNLSAEDSSKLVRALAARDIGEAEIREIFSLTGGNPKLVTAFCQDLRSGGETGRPKSLEAFFERRIQNLKPEEKRVFLVIASAEVVATPQDLLTLTGFSSPVLKRCLSRLEHLGLTQAGEAGSFGYRILHRLPAEIALQALKDTERAKLHERWAGLLEARNGGPEEWTALAIHAAELPTHPRRSEWILRASGLLRARGNFAKAAALLEKGLPLASPGGERESFLRELANVYGRMGDFQKSKRLVELWFQEFPSDPGGLNPLKHGLSTGIACKNLGEPEEAARRLHSALERGNPSLETHRPYLARSHSLLGLLALEGGRFEEAEKNFAEAVGLLPETDELRAEVQKYRAMSAAKQGLWDESQEELDAAERVYRDLGDSKGLFAVLLERGNLAVKRGDRDEAAAAYDRAYETAARASDEASLARVHHNLGLLAAREGDFSRALEEFERAAGLLLFFGSPHERALNFLEQALTHASVGNFSISRERRGEAEKIKVVDAEVRERSAEVSALSAFLENGTAPESLPSPDRGEPPAWDMERHWLNLCFGPGKKDTDALRALLEGLHDRLPDALKIGFEERFDYKTWVVREERPPPQETDMETLQKMHAITRDLFASDNMTLILERIMDAAMEISRAERGFLVIPGGPGSGPFPGYEVKIARNLSRETLEDEASGVSLSAVREAMKTGQPLVTDNAFKDPRLMEAASVQQLQLKSILVLPLKGPQGLMGAIYLDHRFQAQIFRGADLQLLQVFADQAGLALQKAQLVEKLQTSNQTLSQTVAEQTDELSHLRREVDDQRGKLSYEYGEIVGRSPKMQEVLFLVDRLIESSIPVWVFGESGTGKEMIARALHFKGPRRKKAFVSENCSALPEQLLESELFGHKRGAFTHADRDKKGLLQYADGGTVFLDEIADTSPTLQAKLLRFLQEKEFRPVGSNEVVRVDVRIVSASNKDLNQLVREGKFREDLFYRLNGVTVHLPPLRDRIEDLPLLARHFLKKVAEAEKKNPLEVGADAMEILMDYPWPGNVRELENSLQTACLFHVKGKLVAKSFHFKKALFEEAPPVQTSATISVGSKPAKVHSVLSTPALSEDARLLLKALQDNCYHKGLAAKQLGITRRYLYKKLTKLGIPVDRVKMKGYAEKELGSG